MFAGKALKKHLHLILNALILLQGISAIYFLGDFIVDLVELEYSFAHAVLEGVAVLCLFIGIYFSLRERERLLQRNEKVEAQLQMASGSFRELLNSYFERWGLTPSEREIALFTIKGFSNAEIAALRDTREGTVKAQSNAIFRKAGVSGRMQLVSLFIEELVADPVVAPAGAPAVPEETAASVADEVAGATVGGHS